MSSRVRRCMRLPPAINLAFVMLPCVTSTITSRAIISALGQPASLREVLTRHVRGTDSFAQNKSIVDQPGGASMDTAKSLGVQFSHLQGNESAWEAGGAETTSSALRAAHTKGQPRVFFLFMAMAGLVHEQLWEDFFSNTQKTLWRAFIHCVDGSTCSLHFAVHNPMGMSQVPTVPSKYCSDLVSPMIQLVSHAVQDSYSPDDKFLFVSETTLPVKPFDLVYRTLMSTKGSDICVAPSQEWASMQNAQGQEAKLVKHSQWVVLNQKHARVLVHRWSQATQYPSYWRVPMWPEKLGVIARIPRSLSVCADEWLPMAMMYGMIFTDSGTHINLPEFSPWNSLQLSGTGILNRAQGNCHTWVGWGRRTNGTQAAGDAIMRHPGIHLQCSNGCTGSHPILIKHVTESGLHQFLLSPFLFARKFADGAVSRYQYNHVILSAHNLL